MRWVETALARPCACATGALCPETTHAWYQRERRLVRTSVSLAPLGPVTVWLNVPAGLVDDFKLECARHPSADVRFLTRGVHAHLYRFHPTDDDCAFLTTWIARSDLTRP